MTNPDALELCIACNKSTTLSCGRCKSARYCSPACQKADWPIHKLLCATFSNFDVSSRPTDNHIRAILFPVNQEKPKIIWLQSVWLNNGHEMLHCLETRPVLGHDDSLACYQVVEFNKVLNRKLSDTIVIGYRDEFLLDGSNPNKSIAAIASIMPTPYREWRGPLFAYGSVGVKNAKLIYRDLDMIDFRHITDFLYAYGNKPVISSYFGTPVYAVKINCIGDQKMFNKPHFEPVELRAIDVIFVEHDTSDIATRIGFPIITRKCPPDPKWANDRRDKTFEGLIPTNNQAATFLHLCCDPKAECWGWTSMRWQNNVGSVIVARQDKRPLLPLHVEALCNYCQYEIRPLLAHSLGEYKSEKPLAKNDVLTMICRPTFFIYYNKLLEDRIKAGEKIDVPHPFSE